MSKLCPDKTARSMEPHREPVRSTGGACAAQVPARPQDPPANITNDDGGLNLD